MADAAKDTVSELSSNVVPPVDGTPPGSQEDGSQGFDSSEAWNQGGLASDAESDRSAYGTDDESTENTVPDATDLDELIDGGSSSEDAKLADSQKAESSDQQPESQTGEKDKGISDNPVFKRLHGENMELKGTLKELQTQIKTITDMVSGKAKNDQGSQGSEKDYKDLTEYMDNPDALIDEFNDDPLGFLGNFARQVQSEVTDAVMKKLGDRDIQGKVKTSIEGFATDNEDFKQMLVDGSLDRYMKENPAFNHPVAAYYQMTFQDKMDALKDRVSKETEEKVLKSVKTIGLNTSTFSVKGAPKDSASEEQELQNTKKRGGLENVLAKSLLSMRRKKA